MRRDKRWFDMYEKTQIKISSKMKEKAKYVEFQIDQIHQGDSAC